jgi:hypothetical protein
MPALGIAGQQEVGTHGLEHLGIKRCRRVVVEVNHGRFTQRYGEFHTRGANENRETSILLRVAPLSKASQREQQADDKHRNANNKEWSRPERHAHNHEREAHNQAGQTAEQANDPDQNSEWQRDEIPEGRQNAYHGWNQPARCYAGGGSPLPWRIRWV